MGFYCASLRAPAVPVENKTRETRLSVGRAETLTLARGSDVQGGRPFRQAAAKRRLHRLPSLGPTPSGLLYGIPPATPSAASCPCPRPSSCFRRHATLFPASGPLHLLCPPLRTRFCLTGLSLHSSGSLFTRYLLREALPDTPRAAPPPSLSPPCPASVYSLTLIPPRYWNAYLCWVFYALYIFFIHHWIPNTTRVRHVVETRF